MTDLHSLTLLRTPLGTILEPKWSLPGVSWNPIFSAVVPFLGSKMVSKMVSYALKRIINKHPGLDILDSALMRQTLRHLNFL